MVSGSPEERETYVGELITAEEPKIILCSTLYRESVKTTFTYFIEKGYFIFVHWLNPGYSDPDAPYYDHLDLTNWLLSQQSLIGIRCGKEVAEPRVEEMREFIYGWAKPRNLVFNEC